MGGRVKVDEGSGGEAAGDLLSPTVRATYWWYLGYAFSVGVGQEGAEERDGNEEDRRRFSARVVGCVCGT